MQRQNLGSLESPGPAKELEGCRAGWLGLWGGFLADYAAPNNRRICLFNFAAGEPEPEHWLEGGMHQLLEYVAQHKDQVAIGLHEYSYQVDDAPGLNGQPSIPAIWRGYPWMVGRFQQLWAACDQMNIAHPSVLVTEFGWRQDAIPDQNRALRDIKIANELYQNPDFLGGGLWYSGGGKAWKGIYLKVERLFPGWGDYMGSLDPGDDPAGPAPQPIPTPATIDLAQFIVGVPGVQHVLQCRFGAIFEGTQTLCTLDLGDQIFAQQKDADQEIIYYDDHHIYRETDTSPGDHDGRKAFYCQYEGVRRGAYWCHRHVRVGDLFDRMPDVLHMYTDNCSIFAADPAPTQLRVVAYHDNYLFGDGYLFDAPVVELAWEVDGRIIERYFYGYQRGLVKWVEEERGWKSYLVAEHTDRPPMPDPAWPLCHHRPTPDFLYYRQPDPEPEPIINDPEPDPRAYHRIFHLLSETIEPESPMALMVWHIASKMRSTCGYSWHDAVIDNPFLLSRTVHTWDLLQHERDALEAFQHQHFRGEVIFHHHETDDPHLSWEQF